MNEIPVRIYAAADERQYMIEDDFEVYEKQGTPTGAMTFHCHNFYEIIYVMEGEYALAIDNKIFRMKKGDFLLVNQNLMHKCYAEDGQDNSSRRIILWITDNMLQKLSDGHGNLAGCFEKKQAGAYHFPIVYEEMLRGYLMKLTLTMLPEVKNKEMKRIIDRGYLTLFFGYLNMLIEKKEYGALIEETAQSSLVRTVDKYIEAHMREQINVDDLAKQVHMSKFHFLRKFKEQSGITVHNYIVHKRLVEAGQRLKNGESILEAGQNVGFQDYTSFLRNFKKVYGVSPGHYKQLNENDG